MEPISQRDLSVNALAALARNIDALSEFVGRAISWIILPMVLVQLTVVLMRYVFGVGSIMMQESVVYMHATLFMMTAGYTLLHNGHVRIDILYREASARRKALVDLGGVIVFLLPVCVLTWWVAWPYVATAWSVLEGSRETSGIPAVFLLKTLILVFAALVAIQSVSQAIRAGFTLLGLKWPEGGKPREPEAT